MKNLIWMAALALTAATWSACSNEDVPTVTDQPAQARTYTVTTTLSPRNGGTRSTMTDNGNGSISATWAVGDKILVGYYKNGNDFVNTTAEVTAVNPSTKAATITVSLTNPSNGGYITYKYPVSFYDGTKDVAKDQIGTLDDVNDNFAALWGDGSINVSGSDVTLSSVTMEPQMCIWKFSFTDGSSDITDAITKLIIDFPSYGTYEVSPSSQSTIYVALHGDVIKADPICITAQTPSGVYRKAAASVTLAKGTTYTSTDLALKKAEVGKVFGADGNIYDNADATPGGNTARALITYVGNDNCEAEPYNHGLALAMSDANSGNTCIWETSNTDAGHIQQGSPFTIESGLQYNATHNTDDYPAFKYAIANNSTAAPVGCSAWFLASGYQWGKMLTAAGSHTALRDGFYGVGGTNMQSKNYWSSSECDDSQAWAYVFESGNAGVGFKSSNKYVRSALAF